MRVFFAKKKEWPLVILSVLFFGSINAQFSSKEKQTIDSLSRVISNKNSHDTSKAASYVWLSEILYSQNMDTMLVLCVKAEKIALSSLRKNPIKKIEKALKNSLGWAYNNIGGVHFAKGNMAIASTYYQKSLKIWRELDDLEGIAYLLNNIGGVYENQGDLPKGLDYFHQSLKIREQIGDKRETANTLSNIGMVYQTYDDVEHAFEYANKALKLREELGEKREISDSYNHLGTLYKQYGDPYVKDSKEASVKAGLTKALSFYHKSLKIREESGLRDLVANSFNNLGSLYRDHQVFDSSLYYFQKALAINSQSEDKSGLTLSFHNLGLLYYNMGNYQDAFDYTKKGLEVAQDLGFPIPIKHNASLLSRIAIKLNDCDLALEMRNLEVKMIDSLNSERNFRALANQQAKYEYESLKAVEEKEHEKEIALAQEREEKQKIISYSAAGASILLIAFLVFVFNRLKISRRQKKQIEGQKQDLEKAHHQLTEHHMEIQDSIKYAKRIQEAILPSMAAMQSDLKNGFVLYKPKDVVAGDFFWMEIASPVEALEAQKHVTISPLGTSSASVSDIIYFAAADCTGHGVPGAMMSVVCSNALSKALLEEKAQSTGELLDKTRDIVVNRMAKSGEDVKDGMDVSVCALNFKTMKLQWSGANNPLWIVRANRTPNEAEVTGTGNVPSSSDISTPLDVRSELSHYSFQEIKADKQPIGKYADNSPFTTHEIELQKGDTLYIFTDGYQDQFGGEKGKKFKASQLKEKLLSIQHLSMNEQKEFLNSAFENWKGQIEQVDDVCIIGVRI